MSDNLITTEFFMTPIDEWMAEIQRLREENKHLTARHDELAGMNAELGLLLERVRLAGAVEMVVQDEIACPCTDDECHRMLYVTDDILQIEDEDSGLLLSIMLPEGVRLYREVTP